jgi:catechol 2,3-dioxygenase-like lactoylglutathione lyase family enzyme
MPATTPVLGLGAIGQIAMNATDIPRAVRFYRDTLGLPFLFQVPRMAFFDCAGVRLMLGLPDAPEFDHPGSVLYFRVDDMCAGPRRAQGARRNLPTSLTSSRACRITSCG